MKRNLEDGLAPTLVFTASLAVYLATLPRCVLPGDSPQLVAASYTLSIGHPPGFPLYMMAGKLFASVFAFGSVAMRYNLFSAVTASAAVALTFLIMARLGVGRLLALAVTLGLATLQCYWLQATVGDIYALNGLFTALMIFVALGARRLGARALPLLAFTGGLALSHHLTLVYGLASALAILALQSRARPGPQAVLLSVFLFCLGMTVWLYVPIRAALRPPVVWGRTDTFPGFWAHVTAKNFRWHLRMFDIGDRIVDVIVYFKTLAMASGGLMLLPAGLAVVSNRRRFKCVAGVLALILLYAVHFALYNIPDIDSHLLPALLAVTVLAGLGLQRIHDLRRAGRAGPAVAMGFAGLVLAINLAHIQPRRDQWFALDYARAVEANAVAARGKDCVLVCSADVCFPLLYDSVVGTSAVRTLIAGVTDPRAAGLPDGLESLDDWVSATAEKYGASKIALFGAPVPQLAKMTTRACGLIQVLGEDGAQCPATLSPIRGVAADLRDFGSRRQSADYYLRLARWKAEEGDTTAARENVARALAAGYDDVASYLDAAYLYREMGNTGEAKRLAEEALRIDRDSFEAHAVLAGIALREGNAGVAVAEYTEALKGTSAPGPMHSNLGAAYLAEHNYGAASDNFKQALDLDSTLVTAYVGLGRIMEAWNRPGDALRYYDRALLCDSSSALAASSRAAVLERMGR